MRNRRQDSQATEIRQTRKDRWNKRSPYSGTPRRPSAPEFFVILRSLPDPIGYPGE